MRHYKLVDLWERPFFGLNAENGDVNTDTPPHAGQYSGAGGDEPDTEGSAGQDDANLDKGDITKIGTGTRSKDVAASGGTNADPATVEALKRARSYTANGSEGLRSYGDSGPGDEADDIATDNS
jgi:hypothetical protein